MTIYCIVPPDLAGKLGEFLRELYGDDPSVEVVVDRRRDLERRRAGRRRVVGGTRPDDRRVIRNADGRRAGERRAPAVPVAPPTKLPRAARRHADRLLFVERLVPTARQLEDLETDRLVARFQGGDEAAFRELYLRYVDRIYAYSRVGLRDSHEAEDIAQQVFSKAFVHLPRFEIRRGQPLRNWLFRVARNEVIDHLERRGRVSPVAPDCLEREYATRTEGDLELPLDWVTDKDLLVLLERLPLDHRQAITLQYLMGLTSEEVGAVMGRSPESVRQLQHRAVAFLRQRLAAAGRHGARHRQSSPALVMLRQAPVLRTRRFVLAWR